MQIHYTKAAFTALWILAVALAAFMSNVPSTSGWIILVALAAIPPAVVWRLWNPPMASMSESIRTAMKD